MARPRPRWRWAFPVWLLAALMNVLPRAARPQEQQALPHLTPDEVRLYQHARTVMDWSPEKIRSRPELKNLQAAESQRDLPMILQKVGERVAMLVEELPGTTFMDKPKVQGQYDRPGSHGGFRAVGTGSGNRYLLLVHSRQGMPVLYEYRISAQLALLDLLDLPPNPNKNAVDYILLPPAPLRVSRFLAAALNFLPQMQATCRFRHLGRQVVNERESVVVGFAQIPEGDPAVNTFRTPDKTVGLLVQGLAWFDAKSYEILRIQTDLLAPRPEVGLKEVRIKVDFSAIHIEGAELFRRGETPPTFQLPTRAVVDAKSAGQKTRTIHDYSDFKLFRAETRISPTTESELAFPPGGNPAPATVKPQPWSLDDIWVRFLERDYVLGASAPRESKGRDSDGGWRLNYDRKMLGFTQEQFKPIHEAARRLREELMEIDARKKALMDAARAAHPEPPELNAPNEQYKALLESDVDNLKVILGLRAAATLDKYARAHFAQLAAHSPLPGFAGAHDPHIESLRMYDLLLERVVAHDQSTADSEELGSMGGVYWPNIPRDNLAFTDQDTKNRLDFTEKQYEHVRVVAIRVAPARKERFAEWKALFAAYSATTFASPELKALDQQRQDTIATELSDLRRALGPDLCARLDAYFRVHYGL